MSIASLFTEPVKPDQNLKINSINGNIVEIEWAEYSQDYTVSPIVNITTYSGSVFLTSCPNIAAGDANINNVFLNFAGLDSQNCVCILTNNAGNNAENGKLLMNDYSKPTNQIGISIQNVSSTNFTGGGYVFDYLIIPGLP